MFDVDAPVGYLGHRGVGYLIGHLAAAVVARHHGQGKRQVAVGLLAYLGHRELGKVESYYGKCSRDILESIVFGFAAGEGNLKLAHLRGLANFARDLRTSCEYRIGFTQNKSLIGIGELGHLGSLAALFIIGRHREGGLCHHERHVLLGSDMSVGGRLFHREGRLARVLDADAAVDNNRHRGVGYRIREFAAAVARHFGQGKRQVAIGLRPYLGHGEPGMVGCPYREGSRFVFKRVILGLTPREHNIELAYLRGLGNFARDFGKRGQRGGIIVIGKARIEERELGYRLTLEALLIIGGHRKGGFRHRERQRLLGSRVAVGCSLFHREGGLSRPLDVDKTIGNSGDSRVGNGVGNGAQFAIGGHRRQGKRLVAIGLRIDGQHRKLGGYRLDGKGCVGKYKVIVVGESARKRDGERAQRRRVGRTRSDRFLRQILFILPGNKAFVGNGKVRIGLAIITRGVGHAHRQGALGHRHRQDERLGRREIVRSLLFQHDVRRAGSHNGHPTVLDCHDARIFGRIFERGLIVVGGYRQGKRFVAIVFESYRIGRETGHRRLDGEGRRTIREGVIVGSGTTHQNRILAHGRLGKGVAFHLRHDRERRSVVTVDKAFVRKGEIGVLLAIVAGGIDSGNGKRSLLHDIGKEVGDALRVILRSGLHGNDHRRTDMFGLHLAIGKFHNRGVGNRIDDFALGIVRRNIERTGLFAINRRVGKGDVDNRLCLVDGEVTGMILELVIGGFGSFGRHRIDTDRRQGVGLPAKHRFYRQGRRIVVIDKTRVRELSGRIGLTIRTLGIERLYRKQGLVHNHLYRVGTGKIVFAGLLQGHQRGRSHAHDFELVAFDHSHLAVESLIEQLLLFVVLFHFGQCEQRLSVGKRVDGSHFEMRSGLADKERTVLIGKIIIGRLGPRRFHDILAHLGIDTGLGCRNGSYRDGRRVIVVDKAAVCEREGGILFAVETRRVGHGNRKHRLVDLQFDLDGVGSMIVGRLILTHGENRFTGILYHDLPIGKTSHRRIGGRATQNAVGIVRGESHRLAAVNDLYGSGVDKRSQFVDNEFGPLDIDQLVIIGRTAREGDGIFSRVGIDDSRGLGLGQFAERMGTVVTYKAFIPNDKGRILGFIKAHRVGHRNSEAGFFHDKGDRVGHIAVVAATLLRDFEPSLTGSQYVDFPVGNRSHGFIGNGIGICPVGIGRRDCRESDGLGSIDGRVDSRNGEAAGQRVDGEMTGTIFDFIIPGSRSRRYNFVAADFTLGRSLGRHDRLGSEHRSIFTVDKAFIDDAEIGVCRAIETRRVGHRNQQRSFLHDELYLGLDEFGKVLGRRLRNGKSRFAQGFHDNASLLIEVGHVGVGNDTGKRSLVVVGNNRERLIAIFFVNGFGRDLGHGLGDGELGRFLRENKLVAVRASAREGNIINAEIGIDGGIGGGNGLLLQYRRVVVEKEAFVNEPEVRVGLAVVTAGIGHRDVERRFRNGQHAGAGREGVPRVLAASDGEFIFSGRRCGQSRSNHFGVLGHGGVLPYPAGIYKAIGLGIFLTIHAGRVGDEHLQGIFVDCGRMCRFAKRVSRPLCGHFHRIGTGQHVLEEHVGRTEHHRIAHKQIAGIVDGDFIGIGFFDSRPGYAHREGSFSGRRLDARRGEQFPRTGSNRGEGRRPVVGNHPHLDGIVGSRRKPRNAVGRIEEGGIVDRLASIGLLDDYII